MHHKCLAIKTRELGSIMTNFFKSPEAASACIKSDVSSISLSDCLACSGCITSDESQLFKTDTSFLEDRTVLTSFIISPHSKKSLYLFYNQLSFEDFEKCLVCYLRQTFNVGKIVDTSYFKKKDNVGISSECPAVVLYVERVYPQLAELLSTQKSYQQMASDYLKDYSGKVVSIMQCYDKKDELGRDNTCIDHFIGTREFYEFIKDTFFPYSMEYSHYQVEECETTHLYTLESVSGLENCINLLNSAKNGVAGDVEMRICKNGCINGPAQAKTETKDLEEFGIGARDDKRIYCETAPRAFKKSKKKTFNIEW